MYDDRNMYQCPYWANANMNNTWKMYSCPYWFNPEMYSPDFMQQPNNQCIPFAEEEDEDFAELRDYGPDPFVINIEEATMQNVTFRTALWTGEHLQLTLMSIDVGGEIGLEIHPNLDQFIRIEEGDGIVRMGDRKDRLNFQRRVHDDFIFIVPAGKWHNLINTGNKPIKLYSIYAPPQHPWGTVHETKKDAEEAEEHHD